MNGQRMDHRWLACESIGNSIDLKEQILKYLEILKETHVDISSQERNTI